MGIFGLPGELVGIILGWALGVLTPILTWKAIRRREEKELEKALRAELAELRVTLAMEAHGLQERLLGLDESFVRWELSTLNETPGVESNVQKYVEGLRSLLNSPIVPKPVTLETTMMRKGHRLMLLEANLSRLGMLPLEFQQRSLNVLSQLSFWNDDVRLLDELFAKTFDPSLSTINHNIVRTNIEQNYRKALKMARSLVDDIGVVVRS